MTGHFDQAHVLSAELSFGLEIQFLAPPPRNITDVIRRFPQLACIMERDFTYHCLASALAGAGLPAAYIFETTKDECRGHPLRTSAPPGSIVRTRVSNDMRVMSPAPAAPAAPRAVVRRSLSMSSAWASLSSAHSSRVTAQGRNPLFRYWLLKTEANIYGTGPFAAWHPMELNSPILGEYEAAGGFRASQRALAALLLACPEGLRVDRACALHVHVSPSRWELMARHAMRIATLVFLFEEPLLFHLIRPHRGRAHASLRAGAAMARPPAQRPDEPRIRWAPGDLPACLFSEACVHLWTSRGLGDVAEMLARPANRSGARATALGIGAQTHPNGRETHTVEFRHAEASLDAAFLSQWLALVTTIRKVAWLDVERYKSALECVCAVVLPGPAPEDAWRPLLRILNRAAPRHWRRVCDETFWDYHLARQNRR
ncbi:hypothetical protein ESCO_003675 [Escovopsis weberi]|uniref:Uncharacterized protein n=1 Tax=Escovopsis weberi TaxID=150374 RepID=A0A0M9VXF6_ESCWE|nr:hypothetical protein ESCO_003675 [Escovopsis weberi]